MFAAIIIQITKHGIDLPIDYLGHARHLLGIADQFFCLLLPYEKSFCGLNSHTFIHTTINSTRQAGQYLLNSVETKEQENMHHQEQQLWVGRARQASAKLWADWTKRDEHERTEARHLLES